MVQTFNAWRAATCVLMLSLLGIVLHTFGDYGMSWDEYYRNVEGGKKLAYYQDAFAGHWKPYDNNEDLYPGFYDLLHQGLNLLQPCGPGELGLVFTDHLLTAIFGLLTILAAYKVGRQLGGERTGFLAALFLALFPHFYGHMFINPKDIPFACMYLWSVYYTLKLIASPLTPGFVARLAIVYGLTLGVRLGGIFFFGFMGIAFALRLFLKRHEGQLIKKGLSYLGLCILIAIGAFLVLLPWWPFAHPNPLGTLIHGLGRVANYPWNGPVFFNGKTYAAIDLPWFYLPEMLLVTTPLFILGASLAGILIAARNLWKKLPVERFRYFTADRLCVFFVAFSLFFPIAAVILKHATLYDGIRHFLFVLGPWAALAALAAGKLWDGLQEEFRKKPTLSLKLLRFALPASAVIFVLNMALEYRVMHPYQYVYFNSLVGTETRAWNSFDTEYWGTCHREAVELLSQHLARAKDHKVYKVTSPMAPWLVEDFLPSNMVYTVDWREADFFISFLRYNADMWSDGAVMEDCVVYRHGAILAIVRDRRKIIAAQRNGGAKGHTTSMVSGMLLDLLPDLN